MLVSYSRADERQADELGMEYMTRAGHNPKGMVGLMEVLRDQHKNKPNALEIMFSTHPMSDERYATAASRAEGAYPAESAKYPSNRERYMDNTAGLRAMKGAIEKMQNGEKAMVKKKFPEAEGQFSEALSEAPEDYAGLLMMAKCQIAMEKYDRARAYATKAKQVYPNEAQAKHVAGLAGLLKKDYDAALADFDGYERVLPGNPNTIFFKGLCHEKMGHRREAANEYYRYLQQDRSSKQARYSYDRLVQWGYIREEKKQ